MQDGGRGWLVRSECELAGRNKAGMRGMCGPFGDGWTQENILFTVSRALDCDVCVCSDRDTGLTGCIILIREARVAGGFGLGGQDIRRYPGARTFSLVGWVDNRLGQLFCVYGRSGLSSRAARQQDSRAAKRQLKLASDPGTRLSLNLSLSVIISVFIENSKLL
jgi:hypothetical protein